MNIKPIFSKHTAGIALIASLLAACSTPSEDSTNAMTADVSETVTTVDGVPGGVVTRTARLEATVKAIDYDARRVTLVDDNGTQKTVDIGPDAVNFNQVEKGDRVEIAYVEEMAVYLRGAGAAPEDGLSGAAGRAPEGEKPRGFAAGSVEMTAVVTAVDLAEHTATLQFPDGSSHILPVRDDVELSTDHVGREVVVQSTEAVAVSVEKP
ncbi:hypothetical protein [Marinobacter fonticola]|uniref:hypothetical protein n=1 Tax=Marinobacter fonticola TaxID=2603215 RepID=UPI0011E79C14|nr:hypothetical protein [Marinobacter fonticola]